MEEYFVVKFDMDPWTPDGLTDESRCYWRGRASVRLVGDEEEGEDKDVEVGHAIFGVCIPQLGSSHMDTVIECDAVSQDVYEFAEIFYNPSIRRSRSWLRKNVDHWDEDCASLLIEDIWINPDHRRKSLCPTLLRAIVDTYGYGCMICAMSAVPHPEGDPRVWDKALPSVAKFVDYMRRIGFQQMLDTSWVVADLHLRNEILRRALSRVILRKPAKVRTLSFFKDDDPEPAGREKAPPATPPTAT